MKVYSWMLALGCVLCLNPVIGRADSAADEPSGVNLTIELKDGSKLVGKNDDDSLQVHSDVLGKIKLPLSKLRSVDFPASNSVVQITTTNGDAISVQLLTKSVELETSFGEVKLESSLIRHMQISRPGKAGMLPGLVALWSGEGNGVDSVGGHNATVPDGVTFVPAKVGLGFNFDGGNHRVMVPDAPELNFGANQDFSIAVWIQVQPAPPELTTGVMDIVDKRTEEQATFDSPGYAMNLLNGRLQFRFMHRSYGPAGPDLIDGQFHHVAVTVERNSPTGGHLYVDGKVILTFDPTQVPGDSSNSEPLRIGNHCNPNYFSFFHGIIDELGIYNRALPPDEIQSLFQKQ